MRYDYDMLGSRIHQASMEAGERWMLTDVAGQPIYAWDSRNHRFHTNYDALRRAIEFYLREGAGSELMIGRTVYGETRPNPEAKNQRGKVVQLFDQAGVVNSENYDFKGNLLVSRRQLAREYKVTLNWLTNPELEAETFTGGTTYDALNRPLSFTSPDNSVYRPTFNEANLLEKVDVNLRGAQTATTFVTNVDYDAKGQRMLIEYGNGAKTEYEYDPLTFRLRNLKTSRMTDHARLQDLNYTYDPGGNITYIRDNAQQTIYFNNQVVSPDNDYTYDAVYRLIEAKAREHIGQASHPETTWNDEFRVKLQHPQNGQAMRRYTERYEYDSVGNFLELIHRATNGNWKRGYAYNEPSLIEPAKPSNRLSSTQIGDNTPELYPHDAHGNMTAMPHLPRMDWDFNDELRVVDLGGGGTAFYVYDAGGQRVRKVIEKNGGTFIEERIYLGGFEIFRRHNGAGTVTLERETFHVMDDTQRIALVETKTIDIASPLTPHPSLVRYQFNNHLGSASLELDNAGQIISYEEYYAYGSTSYQAGRSAAEVSLKRYRYTGMERDEESGLNYHGARYYAPWLGRWASSDPAEMIDGPNLYLFARSNPIRSTDPSGTDSETPELIEGNPDYAVRNNPDKMFLENANARVNWHNAIDATLESEFGLGSPEKNQAAFENKIDSLDDGPQQVKKRLNLKSKLGYARSISNKILYRFYKAEAVKPSWHYSENQIKTKLAKGQAPDPLQQLEHLNDLARNPKGAIGEDVYFTEGGRKGGIPKDSPHGQKNWGESGRRMRDFQTRMAAPSPPAADVAPPPPTAGSGGEGTSGRGTRIVNETSNEVADAGARNANVANLLVSSIWGVSHAESLAEVVEIAADTATNYMGAELGIYACTPAGPLGMLICGEIGSLTTEIAKDPISFAKIPADVADFVLSGVWFERLVEPLSPEMKRAMGWKW